jgi:ribosomal-protein-alanine N-acetyltransferase
VELAAVRALALDLIRSGVLRTERLILRPWRDDDVEPFAALNADPVVMEHFPAVLDRAQSDAAVARIRTHFDREGFGLWAVEVPGGAPFIGFAGLQRPAFLPAFVEAGWRLARPYWGAGYATEAARAAVDFAFDVLYLPELISMTVPANVRSQRVMAKLGFVRDPDADFEHPNIPAGHPLRPHWLFRLQAPR